MFKNFTYLRTYVFKNVLHIVCVCDYCVHLEFDLRELVDEYLLLFSEWMESGGIRMVIYSLFN